tara:strand:- start:140 stop:625 length:486 start_codon:yes stop_codon:yes gene_type:complete
MKMYQVVNVLGAINETGKLASDMYDIGKKRYYSESHGQEIPISEMDFQYMVRAFIKQNEKIESLKKLVREKDVTATHYREAYKDAMTTNGSRYVFTEIPNNEYGKKLTRGMKVYLNDESYSIRVRGQHVKPELKGTGVTSYGQSIEQSTHLRVYIDKKKGA